MRLRQFAIFVLCFVPTGGAVNIGEINQPCATACISSAISAAGCGDNDITCQCGVPYTAISKLAAPCVVSACMADGDDLGYAPSAIASVCMSAVGRVGSVATTSEAPLRAIVTSASPEAPRSSVPMPTTTTTGSSKSTTWTMLAHSATTLLISGSSSATTTAARISSMSEASYHNTTSTSQASNSSTSTSSRTSQSPSATITPDPATSSPPGPETSGPFALSSWSIAAISLGGVIVMVCASCGAFLFGRRQRPKAVDPGLATMQTGESKIGFGIGAVGGTVKSSRASLVSYGASLRPWPDDEKKIDHELPFELPSRDHYEPAELHVEAGTWKRFELEVDMKGDARR